MTVSREDTVDTVVHLDRPAVDPGREPTEHGAAISVLLGLARRAVGLGTVLVGWSDGQRWRVSYVDDGEFGLNVGVGTTLALSETLCGLVGEEGPTVIDDVAADRRAFGLTVPVGLGVRTFVGVPLVLEDGTRYGTLCALDRRPAAADATAAGALAAAAQLVGRELGRGGAVDDGRAGGGANRGDEVADRLATRLSALDIGTGGRLAGAAKPPGASSEVTRLYGALIEQVPAIVYVQRADEASTTIYVSPQGERLHGWTAEECIADADHWRKLLHPDDRERVLAAEAAGDERGLFDAEYRLRTRDGRYVWLHDRAVMVPDADGRPRYWQGLMFDVTAAKRAEERLRAAETRYRTLVEYLPAITYVDVVWPDGATESRYVSPQVTSMLGWEPEAYQAEAHWRRMLHPEDRERVLSEDARTEATGEPFDVEYRLIARDGRVVWIHDRAVPIDADGKEGGRIWQGVQFDVTARKEGELRLAAAERRERGRLAALLRAASALNEAGTLEALLPALARAAAEAVEADRASVFAYDEGRRRTIGSGHYNAGAADGLPVPSLRQLELDALAPSEVAAESEVLRRGGPLRRDEATRFADRQPAADGRSDVVVPLLAAGAVQGVLYVREAGADRAFRNDEVSLLEAIANQAGLAVLRARDAAAAQRRADHLAVIEQVGRAMAVSLETGELCAIIHREVGRVVAADAFFVAIAEGDGVAWFPYTADEGKVSAGRRLRLDEGPTSWVMRTGRTYVKVGDDDALANAGIPFGDAERRSAAALYVPMARGERLIGVLSVQRYDPTPYDEDDRRTLETIAQQAAAALHNAALFEAARRDRERAERRADHLALLTRIGVALSRSLDVESLCEALHAEIGRVLAVDAGYVALYDEGARQIWVPYMDDRGRRMPANWLPMGDGPTSRAIRTRTAVVVEPGDADGAGRGWLFGEERRSAAALHVPMVRGERVVGVLSVQRYEPIGYDGDDLRTLETIARLAANAFAHAKLHAATRAGRDAAARHAANLEAVLAIGKAIASATDLETVLGVLGSELGALVPYDAIALYRVAASGSELRPVFAQVGGVTVDAAGWVLLGMGEGIVGHAYLSGRAEVVNDAHLDPRSAYPIDGQGYRTSGHHVMVAPLLVADEGDGVLYVSRRTGPTFGAGEFSLFRVVAEQAATAVRNADLLAHNRELYLGGIGALVSAVDAKDPYTRGHSERVGRLAGRMARGLAMEPAEVEALEVAGLLHDIGKIGVPDAILQKPAPLDDAERAIMVEHAALGAEILAAGGTEALRRVAPLVRHHHEWVNGCGYPDGLAGEAIPLGAAIIAAADAFDTMVTDRPYRSRRTASAAIGELRQRVGKQFRHEVVEVLAEAVGGEEASGSGGAAEGVGEAATEPTGHSSAQRERTRHEGGQMGDTRALGLLVELAAVTRHIPDLSQFLGRVTEIVQRRLDYHGVRLLVVRGKSTELVVAGWAGGALGAAWGEEAGIEPELVEELARSGLPRIVPRGVTAAGGDDRTTTVGSALLVPLVVDDRLIGMIEVASRWGAAFTDADEAVLTAVAGQVAAAVHVAQLHDAAKRAATTDGLTGLANHRAFYEALRGAVASGVPFSVLLMDVEGLKRVNDSAGHLAGDELLRRVARTVLAEVRAGDVVARYGGDEFGVVMVGTGGEEATRVAQRIRRRLQRTAAATVRYGVAAMPEDGDRARELVDVADRRLYGMRNRVGQARRPARPRSNGVRAAVSS